MQDNIFILPRRQAPAKPGWIVSNNLPAQLTPLIGREAEVADVCALLRRPEVRLLTLTGTGGVGKTRLGLQVAAHLLEDCADGVCFVSLAPISDPALVLPTIAQTFGLREAGDQSPLEQLTASLHEKQLLLLLDNFEQVLEAAPGPAELLLVCPHLKILVTSRAALHLQGEYEFAVPPLALPDLSRPSPSEDLAQSAAVLLFLQRARAIKPDFHFTPTNAHAIAEICIRIDGLPLAIELAAARIKLLPPQMLLARLSRRLQVLTGGARNLPARQQTLRNTIAWSYDLLTTEEQRLFRWLSVFVGGCTLEAVEAVCTAAKDFAIEEVLEGVASLIDKSLVQQTEREGEEPRLLLLETIREYGLDYLQAEGELAVAQHEHATYYLQLAEEAEPWLRGPEQLVWLARLEREHENLRAVIDWALASGQRELALRMISALYLFWVRWGYPREGSALLEQALAGSEAAATPLRAKAVYAAAALAYWQQDFRRLESFTEAYLPLAQELGDQQSMALARFAQGLVALQRHEDAAARALFEESLVGLREPGDSYWIASIRLNLGRLALRQGADQRALTLLEENLALTRASGDTSNEAWTLLSLGQLALAQADLTTAQKQLEEGLDLSRRTSESSAIAYALTLLGWTTLQQGKFDEAHTRLKESLQLYREQGNRWGIARSLLLFAHLTTAEGDLAEARARYQESLSTAREMGFKGFTASGLKGLGVVVAAQGQFSWAAQLWGAAEQLREGRDVSLPAALYEQSVEAARTHLGEQALVTALAEGRMMTPEQVLAAKVMAPTPVPARPASASPMKSPPYPAGLTGREMEVLRLMAQGMTNPQIAERLIISLHTVNAHVRSIYTKLELNSRSALTRYALEHHLL